MATTAADSDLAADWVAYPAEAQDPRAAAAEAAQTEDKSTPADAPAATAAPAAAAPDTAANGGAGGSSENDDGEGSDDDDSGSEDDSAVLARLDELRDALVAMERSNDTRFAMLVGCMGVLWLYAHLSGSMIYHLRGF
jgi:hypothetical protein